MCIKERILRRERSIFFRGYRYTLQDQDTTWPAACESVCRGHGEKGFIYMGFQVWSLRCVAWFGMVFLFLFVNLIYCAKTGVHVTHTKRCLVLGTRRRDSRYCSKSCWGSGVPYSFPASLLPSESQASIVGVLSLLVSFPPCGFCAVPMHAFRLLYIVLPCLCDVSRLVFACT